MIARSPVVAQNKIVVALPADQEGKVVEWNATPVSRRIDHGQSRHPAALGGLSTRRGHRSVAPVTARAARIGPGILGSRRHLFRAQHLAMGAVAADLGPGEYDIESEMGLDLLPHCLQQVPEEFFDLSAAQADDVRMLLLQARFVIV